MIATTEQKYMHLGLCLQPVFLERTKQNHIYYPDSSKVGENEYSRDTEKEKDRRKKVDIEKNTEPPRLLERNSGSQRERQTYKEI